MALEKAAAYEMLWSHEAHCRQHGLCRLRILESGDAARFAGAFSSPVAILPCLSSVARRRLKASMSPSAVKPMGSQNPKGACTAVLRIVQNSAEAGPCFSDITHHILPLSAHGEVERLRGTHKDYLAAKPNTKESGACTPSSFSKALTTTFRVPPQAVL